MRFVCPGAVAVGIIFVLAAGSHPQSAEVLPDALSKMARPIVLLAGPESYRSGLVVANADGVAYVVTTTGLNHDLGTTVPVFVPPDVGTSHAGTLVERDDGSTKTPGSWNTLGLELYRVPGIAVLPPTFSLGDVGSAPVILAGYGTSSVALWKDVTHTLGLNIVDSTVSRRERFGYLEFRGESGFGTGGAVAFDEKSGTVVAVLDAVGPLDPGDDYNAHSIDALAAFLGRQHISISRVKVTAQPDRYRDHASAVTYCLQGKRSTTTMWNGQKTKPAVGTAVAVFATAEKSYLLTMLNANSFPNIEGAVLPQEDATLYPVTVAAHDDATGLTLLTIQKGQLPTVDVARSVVAPSDVTALYVGEEKSVFSPCTDQPRMFSSGVINVVHGDGDLVEHSAGTDAFYRGSPLFDDKFGMLVGLANDRDVGSMSDFRSLGPGALRRFLTKNQIDIGSGLALSSGDTPAGYRRAEGSLVRITAGKMVGTGVSVGVLRGKSVVLTSGHVVAQGADPIVYISGRAAPLSATVTDRDRQDDLLLLSVAGSRLPAQPLATRLAAGESIAIAGYPYTSYEFSWHSPPMKVNRGIVSTIYAREGRFTHTAATDEGNSGGPIFSPTTGCLYGIVTGELPIQNPAPGGLVNQGFTGYYAVSADRIRRLLSAADVIETPTATPC